MAYRLILSLEIVKIYKSVSLVIILLRLLLDSINDSDNLILNEVSKSLCVLLWRHTGYVFAEESCFHNVFEVLLSLEDCQVVNNADYVENVSLGAHDPSVEFFEHVSRRQQINFL